MVTLLAPVYFYVGLGVAAGAVGLHFIVTRPPESSVLPTARFVPKGAVRVTTLARPEDLVVLGVRVLLVVLVGLAFARPVVVAERRVLGRVVVADVSRAVGSVEEVRDSVRALLAGGDVLVVFDTAAEVVRRGALERLGRLERRGREGRLSPALIAALRAGAELRAEVDSVEIVLVSALRASEVDGATQAIRALWPGRVRLVRVGARADGLGPAEGVEVRGAAEEDGVVLAVRLAGLGGGGGEAAVRIVRGEAAAEDSVWAEGGRRTLVRWPAEGAPPGWRERARVDTAGAVVAGEAALVYPFERRWEVGPAAGAAVDGGGREGGAGGGRSGGRVVARWVDGEPAAVERAVGEGCIRDVALAVPERGDLVLRPAFGRLVGALGAPCEAAAAAGPGLGEEALRALAGEGPLASREAIAPPETVATPLVPWLLALALALGLLELWVRRGAGGARAGEASREGGTGGGIGGAALAGRAAGGSAAAGGGGGA